MPTLHTLLRVSIQPRFVKDKKTHVYQANFGRVMVVANSATSRAESCTIRAKTTQQCFVAGAA